MAQLSRHRLGNLSLGVESSAFMGIENSLAGTLAPLVGAGPGQARPSVHR